MHRKSYTPEPKIHFDLPLPVFEDDSINNNKEEVTPDNQNTITSFHDMSLPTLSNSGRIPRISPHTFVLLLKNQLAQHFKKIIINDCRYNYEYQGGHIKDAVNINTTEMLFQSYFTKDSIEANRGCVLIFHCEFSKNRGPELAGYLRELDRTYNSENYPNLYYPDLYILDGGYSKFYENYPEFCDGGYVKMRDKMHRKSGEMNRSGNRYRESMYESNKRIRNHHNENVDMNDQTSPTQKKIGRHARKNMPENSSTIQLLEF